MPTQDMIIGLYHLTHREAGRAGRGSGVQLRRRGADGVRRRRAAPAGADQAAAAGLHRDRQRGWAVDPPEGWQPGDPITVRRRWAGCCSTRRCRRATAFINYEVRRASCRRSSTTWPSGTRRWHLAATLDALKEAGFHWATWSGVTISIEDVVPPPRKREILERYEQEAERIDKQYQRGLMTSEERRGELIEIWTKATNEVAQEMEKALPQDNPLWKMIHSGARGNLLQLRQIAAIRGLVANPKGEIIPRPIKSQLPGGSDRAGVLHLHARCPEGSGRHRPADRGLGLPDPSSGRRVAGRDRPRGGLRHRPGDPDAGGPAARTAARGARARRDRGARPYPRRGRQ